MTKELNKNQLGLTLGTVFGIMHLLWIIIVGAGLGQALANLLHSAHFLSDMPTLASFSIGTAITGLVGAILSGYVTGWVVALIWNWFGTKLK